MSKPIQKAGAIIMRTREDGEREIFLIHRQRYDDWSLPKGHIDEGEDAEEAAMREVREETGFRCHVITDFPDYEYTLPTGEPVQVKMFMAELIDPQQQFIPEDDEADEGEWVTLSEAYKRITYKNTVDYLHSLFEIQ